jgi:hypothetical protein
MPWSTPTAGAVPALDPLAPSGLRSLPHGPSSRDAGSQPSEAWGGLTSRRLRPAAGAPDRALCRARRSRSGDGGDGSRSDTRDQRPPGAPPRSGDGCLRSACRPWGHPHRNPVTAPHKSHTSVQGQGRRPPPHPLLCPSYRDHAPRGTNRTPTSTSTGRKGSCAHLSQLISDTRGRPTTGWAGIRSRPLFGCLRSPCSPPLFLQLSGSAQGPHPHPQARDTIHSGRANMDYKTTRQG